MEALLYAKPGQIVSLTDVAPGFPSGMPLLKVPRAGAAGRDVRYMGPLDTFADGMTAARFVKICVSGRLPPGAPGRVQPLTRNLRVLAQRFLEQLGPEADVVTDLQWSGPCTGY